jgi:hypothetical protein
MDGPLAQSVVLRAYSENYVEILSEIRGGREFDPRMGQTIFFPFFLILTSNTQHTIAYNTQRGTPNPMLTCSMPETME